MLILLVRILSVYFGLEKHGFGKTFVLREIYFGLLKHGLGKALALKESTNN